MNARPAHQTNAQESMRRWKDVLEKEYARVGARVILNSSVPEMRLCSLPHTLDLNALEDKMRDNGVAFTNITLASTVSGDQEIVISLSAPSRSLCPSLESLLLLLLVLALGAVGVFFFF